MNTPVSNTKAIMDTSSKRKYRDALNNIIPGVTTILGVIAKPALIDWAWKLGKQGIDYNTVKDDAATVGTIAHFLCECHMKGIEPDEAQFDPEKLKTAMICFEKFKEFWSKANLKVLHNELAITSKYYGGTIDIVAEDEEGKLVIVDIKTSNGIYPEYWSQVAAYCSLWNNRDQPDITRKIIVRIGKDDANDLEVIEKSNLDLYLELFIGALAIYQAQKEIRKLEKK